MVGLGFPKDSDQFQKFAKSQEYKFPNINHAEVGMAMASDATLTLLDSNNNPKIIFNFHDAFPISLQGLDFEIVTGSTDYMVGVAMFKYTLFEIEVL